MDTRYNGSMHAVGSHGLANYDRCSRMAGRGLVTVLIVLLVLAAALAGVAAWAARHVYLQRAELRLAPVRTAVYAAENAGIGTPQGTRVIFFGDSRIEGWHPRPELGGAEIIWRGVAGETTAQMLHRFAYDVIALDPAVVVIEAGINDLVAGAALGREAEVAHATTENIAALVGAARSASVEVWLMTVLRPARPAPWRLPFWSDEIHDRVSQVNESLRGLAGDGVVIIDADDRLAGDAGIMPARYASDTLHLNRSGYEQLNLLIADVGGARLNAVQ